MVHGFSLLRRRALLGVLACLAAVGVLLVGSSTLFAATVPPKSVTAPPGQVNFLWSIPSASGSLTGPNDQHLTLRLVGVREYVTRFTDRPVRQAFVVANADFVRRFRRYFADANPNAVLSFSERGHRIPTDIVLQIGPPRWNPKTSTLTFSAVRIPHMEDNLPDTTVHIKRPLIPNPRHFDRASLFIDSSAAPANPFPPGPIIVVGVQPPMSCGLNLMCWGVGVYGTELAPNSQVRLVLAYPGGINIFYVSPQLPSGILYGPEFLLPCGQGLSVYAVGSDVNGFSIQSATASSPCG